MGDRSALQCFVHAADPGEHPAILEALTEHGLELEYEFPEFSPDEVALSVRYLDCESSLGTAEDLAAALQQAAPSAVFELWQDPYYEVAGWYFAHAPGNGTYESECSADGTPLISARKLGEELRALPPGTTLAEWLATSGSKALGIDVLAVMAGFTRRFV